MTSIIYMCYATLIEQTWTVNVSAVKGFDELGSKQNTFFKFVPQV